MTGSTPHLRPVPDTERRLDDGEAELLRRARGGDGQAWARLYQDHHQRLYTDLMFLLDDPAAAEEICQDTFAEALVSLRRFDERSSFATWVRRIGHNLVRKHWRKHARRGRAYDRVSREPGRESRSPESYHLQDQRAEVLSEVLDTLPVSLREVFILRDISGVDVAEVASRLDISEGNVRVRANRARKKIRAALSRLGWLEGDEA